MTVDHTLREAVIVTVDHTLREAVIVTVDHTLREAVIVTVDHTLREAVRMTVDQTLRVTEMWTASPVPCGPGRRLSHDSPMPWLQPNFVVVLLFHTYGEL